MAGSNLNERELWLMQKAWNMARSSGRREDGWKSMEQWLEHQISREGATNKDALALNAPSEVSLLRTLNKA